MSVSSTKWDEEYFLETVQETLSQHPTGNDIDLVEVTDYQRSIPKHKNVAELLLKAQEEDRLLITPRAGVAAQDEMIDILLALQNEGKADILPINPDSYSRTDQYQKADRELEKSIETGRSELNGYPAVAHGVEGCRELFESVDRPIETRNATPRGSLLSTTVIAGGMTKLLCAPVSLALCMEYDLPLEESIKHGQYQSRLAGWLNEQGVKIALETDSTAALGTITTPSITIVTSLIDILAMVEQGAKHIIAAYPTMQNLRQDIAGLRTQRRVIRRYLDEFGYEDVALFQNVHGWNGPFSEDKQRANALIATIASISALSRTAEEMMVKTPEEAQGAPTKESNVAGLTITHEIRNLLRGQRYPDSDDIETESEFIEMGVEAMMDRLLEIGDGDILVGAIKGLESGLYEYPYGAHKSIQGHVKLVRDAAGAVRYLEPGNLPLPDELVEYHQAKIRERREVDPREDYEYIIDDLSEVRAHLPD